MLFDMKKPAGLILLIAAPLIVGYVNQFKGEEIKVDNIASTGMMKVKLLTSPVDPIYTGDQQVPTFRTVSGYCYENIQMKHIGDIETAWNRYTGKGVAIGFVDSGLDINHPDFEGKIDPRSAHIYMKSNVVEKDIGPEYIYHDKASIFSKNYESHGTNVAGVAAAKINDDGIVGVAPDANILAIKCDLYPDSTIEAINYLVECKVDIISLSIGIYAEAYYNQMEQKWHNHKYIDFDPKAKDVFIPAITNALENNIIVIASAGNESSVTHIYPASVDGVIGVGALAFDSHERMARFSNSNDEKEKRGDICNVDIVAPGFVVTDDYTSEGSGYIQTEGTSFAAPIVAGAAALWKEKYPEGTINEFKEDLYHSTKEIADKGWDRYSGYGVLDVYNLLATKPCSLADINIKQNERYQIEDIITGSPVHFYSENNKVAEVSETGLITGKGGGETLIQVASNNVVKKIYVTVKSNGGCGGNIVTSSTIISVLSVAFISLILIKRKSQKE